MKKLLFTLFLLIVFPVFASHIVGGEFELLHVSGNHYKLNMILYFDKLHGSAGARDTSVTVGIYNKSTNALMQEVTLHLYTDTFVKYTQPECGDPQTLSTNRIFYSSSVELEASDYKNPSGYYISWQRCCRNYSITNIYSEDPNRVTNARAAGQTFYMEFPPLMKNNTPFINSSPRLFLPLNDFACVGRPYYVNFTGTDDDGDSLTYRLVTPLSTKTADPLPTASSGPYPSIQWRPGFGLLSIIKGDPDLTISSDGLLRCTPKIQGLFVFAVLVEQYRNEIKIGETRRDFQMLVVDGCQPDSPPSIIGKKLTDDTYTYNNTMSVNFAESTPDNERCIKVRVSDPDASNPDVGSQEIVNVRFIPLDFKTDNINAYISGNTKATLVDGSTIDYNLCFTKCPPVPSGRFKIGIIAYDDACSLPLLDTLRVSVYIEPHINTAPFFVTPLVVQTDVTLNESEKIEIPIEIRDSENDALTLKLEGTGFDVAGTGISFVETAHENGLIKGVLKWDAYCDIYDYTQRTQFFVRLVTDDLDPCNTDLPVSKGFNFKVILPGFAPVIIDTDLSTNPDANNLITLNRKIGDAVDFKVLGTQADNNLIKLNVIPQGFALAEHQILFPAASGNGSVSSDFTWNISCANVNLRAKSEYRFWFTVLDDNNKCRIPKWDSVQVAVKIVPLANFKPTFTLTSANEIPLVNGQIKIKRGQTIAVDVAASDVDQHSEAYPLKLDLTSAVGETVKPEGYTFANVQGFPSIQSPFLWTPECSIFKEGVYTNNYTFRFVLNDLQCFNSGLDTLTLNAEVSDVENGFDEFNPPNVITPNGDGCNDFFGLEGLTDAEKVNLKCAVDDLDQKIHLPLDNCIGSFTSIRIYNRWGKEVFKSTDRKFRWYAQSAEAGVYYYFIDFGIREFKGSLSVRP